MLSTNSQNLLHAEKKQCSKSNTYYSPHRNQSQSPLILKAKNNFVQSSLAILLSINTSQPRHIPSPHLHTRQPPDPCPLLIHIQATLIPR